MHAFLHARNASARVCPISVVCVGVPCACIFLVLARTCTRAHEEDMRKHAHIHVCTRLHMQTQAQPDAAVSPTTAEKLQTKTKTGRFGGSATSEDHRVSVLRKVPREERNLVRAAAILASRFAFTSAQMYFPAPDDCADLRQLTRTHARAHTCTQSVGMTRQRQWHC